MKRETLETGICLCLLTLGGLVIAALLTRGCEMRRHAAAPTAAPLAPAKSSTAPVPAQPPAAAAIPETYEAAARQSALTDQPAVLLLSASWCGACKRFEREILPVLKKDAALAPPWLGVIDIDVQAEVANQLLQKDRRIPQLVKVDGKFKGETVTVTPTDRLVAPKSIAQVEKFLKAKPVPPVPPAAGPSGPEASCEAPLQAMQRQRLFLRRGR